VRSLWIFTAVPVLLSLSFASDLKIRVLDPQSAAVTGARVVLLQDKKAAAVQTTSAEGLATFSGISDGSYRVDVLAAGFARQVVPAKLPHDGPLEIKLRLAATPQTVEVTAARTPVPSDETGSAVTGLDAGALEAMQPVEEADAVRFLPGAVVNNAGRRGGLASLFVRGGDSRYNEVLIDGVVVNDPGGTFDFGVVPMAAVDRLEFMRGANSTLYGSDAMTSVVQMWSANGTTRTPELRFGADGGTFQTAHGYASLAGARGRFDYNLFGDQFNTNGQGINDQYSNSAEGANVGVAITSKSYFRFRTRHYNSRSGVQSFWNFNGQPLLAPDSDQRARQNNFLASAELGFVTGSRWQHHLSGFEYHHHDTVLDTFADPGRVSPSFGPIDFPFSDFTNVNRAGLEYQGEYWERSWARTTFGYRFEDENGFVGDLTLLPLGHGLRLNHAVYGQQILNWNRASVIAGLRFEHNGSFGNKAVPRVAATYLVLRGGEVFSGTRLRFAYGTGIKEPRFEESFGVGGFGIIPNPNLRAEENRSLEGGLQQSLFGDRLSLQATYFNNLFRNQIEFNFLGTVGQYVNVNESLAHGAELELHGRLLRHLSLDGGYTYTSTEILRAPLCGLIPCNPLLSPGAPLLRRPKHSGTLLLTYLRTRWGADLAGSFVGPRPDSDFEGLIPPVTHAAGYALVNAGTWYAINKRVTAYINLENILNRRYEEAAGYPALKANFRAGMRFRLGGE
jgi:vitamin B12 transporter